MTAAPGRPIPGDDRALCRTIIAAHSKSFALASALLPAGLRDDIAATYAFCRRCDDAVDTGPGDPIAAVRRLRAELASIYDGEAQAEPVLGAFQDVVRRRGIPQEYPRELIEGMAMDAMGARYETFDDLDLYCYRAAGVVGLMLCHVMGVRDERALAHATHLGMAMQLTNICRDVREDAARGRRYVPDTLWRPSPGAGDVSDRGLQRAMANLLARADRLYSSGDRGLRYLPWRCSVAVRAARLIYSAIGVEIARSGYDVMRGRAVVPPWRKRWLAARAVLEELAYLPARVARRIALAVVGKRWRGDVGVGPGPLPALGRTAGRRAEVSDAL